MDARSSTVALSSEAVASLVSESPDGIVVVDSHGTVLFANPAAMRMTRPEGAPLVGTALHSALIGTDLTEIELPETGVVVESRVTKLRWAGRPARLIMLHDVTAARRSAAGEPGTRTASERGAGAAAEPEAGTAGDTAERGRGEEAQRERRRLLEAIADNTTAVVYVRDPAGRYLFSNAAHARILRRRPDELMRLTSYDVVPRRTAEWLLAREAEVVRTGIATLGEEDLEIIEGTVQRWLMVRFPIRDDDGRPYATGVVAMDVTEQSRAREALALSEERFRLLAESSEDMVYLIRPLPEPWVEYVSPASQRVLGIPPEGLTGAVDAVAARLHPDDRFLLRTPFEGWEPVAAKLHRADGSMIWAEVRIAPIHDGSGRVVAVEGNARDITARVEAERERGQLVRQLEQAERLETLGRLAGGVAHDVNNLLAVILGTAELMGEDLVPGHPMRADVERISQTAQRGAALTRQLLIFSRREPSRPQLLDLSDVIGRIEDMLRRTIGEDVEFVTRLSQGLKAVNADRSKLEQVVMNLIVNARAAMPGGGRLLVRTDGVILSRELASPLGNEPPVPPGDYVQLTVSDTGVGMPEEVARHAFEPFFTTHEKGQGSGLGLATVYGVITEAGGYVTLDSRPGAGTTFRIYLPACEADAESVPEPEHELPRGRGETVLVVEDEKAVRDVVTRILSRNDYHVLTACDPAEALRICEEPGMEIDLLLTDVIMPGMSGFQLGERLRAFLPGLPVLYMTGYADSERPAGQDSPRSSDTLSKPFGAATVLRGIREALDSAARPHRSAARRR